jgi:transposase
VKNKRQQLQELNKEQLIDGYLLLVDRVHSLEKQVRDLRQLLEGTVGEVPPKTPKNSSIASGQSRKADKRGKSQAKRGPKAGHVGNSRQRREPDEVSECRVGLCSVCGLDLSCLPQHEAGRHQVTDIPPMRPMIREVVRYGRYCPDCGTCQRASAPAGFETGRVFGPRLERLVVYLHHAHPLSYQRVQHILQDVCGLTVSQGTLVNVVKRSESHLHHAADGILEALRTTAVIGSDETGARVDGQAQWQWVFQTPDWVYHLIHPRRKGDVVRQTMGEATPQVWVSDLGSAQLQHPAQHFQLCLAHQVRDLQYCIDAHRCAWAYQLQSLLYRAMRLGKHRNTLPEAHFVRQTIVIETRLNHLMQTYPPHPDSQNLWRRYRKYAVNLLVFLQRDAVPPTNNASEQALRNSVIYRKVTGGFCTQWGATLYPAVISILETARRQRLNLFDTLDVILSGQPVFSRLGE